MILLKALSLLKSINDVTKLKDFMALSQLQTLLFEKSTSLSDIAMVR
jgi:hypothetical protein